MSKFNKIPLASAGILIMVIGAFVYLQYFREKPFYAVYLQTGDLYFGRLSWFPVPVLRDVHFIRQNPNDAQNPFTIQKFSDAIWGPSEEMRLNRDKIIWAVKLRPDSQILRLLTTQ